MAEFDAVPRKAVCIGGPCDGTVVDVPVDPAQAGWECPNIADPDGWAYVFNVPYYRDVEPKPALPEFYVQYRYEFRGGWRDMTTMKIQLVRTRKLLPAEIKTT